MPGSIIATAILGTSTGIGFAITSFAINMVASAVIARVFAPDQPTINSMAAGNPGSKQTAPPASDNKLPVIYGTAYTGGSLIDMSITSDNQTMYYVIALSEVTNSENGGGGDTFTFGDIYWSGKKVIFDGSDLTKVISLLDTSTALSDNTVNGKMFFYLYRNGSNNPTNTSLTAYQVMTNPLLTYQWNSNKNMSNCVFAIVKLTYNQNANITGLQELRFQLTNSRKVPGDCFYDYLQSSRYGAAIPVANIDTTSLTALNTYSNGTINYTSSGGVPLTMNRFEFDGLLDTNQPVMTNLQLMANSCDCLLKYNEITGLWGVIVQSPTYSVAMALNDSNIISAISVSPLDISNSFNIAEVKYPDGTQQDSFNTVSIDLAVVAPSLLYPNEPTNKQQITLQFINTNVRAQLLANRFLKSCREDLQLQLNINYVGLQLEAGDIVTVTNVNYGWTNKLFRISKIVQNFGDDGSITAALTLMEYNETVFNDASITQFTPAPNTGLSDPLTFGTITAPTITSSSPNAANPSFAVNVTTSTNGIVQYAEVWYSAYSNPTTAQRYFAGTTAILSDGSQYPASSLLTVTLTGIASGDWYFFTRMVNNLGTSNFSAASSLFQWRPTTFTYGNRYLIVAYATSITGTGLTATRSGATYYGLYNSTTTSFSTTASDYTWYLAQPAFGTAYYLSFINRTGRTFSFATSTATYFSTTAAFVPTLPQYDQTLWSALPDGINYIDLDARTGQLTKYGMPSGGNGQISIQNNPNGTLVGELSQLLDFGGAATFTTSAAQITYDIYGRIRQVTPPDNFYYSSWETTATAGQTLFTPTARAASYITGQDLIFRNGVLLDTTEYTETNTTFTLGTGAALNDQIACISFRAISTGTYYESLNIAYASGTGTVTITYTNAPYQNIVAGDILTFSNATGASVNAGSFVVGTYYTILTVGSTNFTLIGASANTVGVIFQATGVGTGTGTATIAPTQYTVSSVNTTAKTITFTGATSGLTAGASIYRYRAINSSYRVFSRYTATLTAASSYTPTTWAFNSGFELPYLNGTAVNDQDYDLVGNVFTNFPATSTGNLTIIQFAPSNSSAPIGSQSSTSTNTIVSQSIYPLSYTPAYFELYNNGALQVAGSDYTTGTGSYTLSVTPTTNLNLLQQQTFNGNGAA